MWNTCSNIPHIKCSYRNLHPWSNAKLASNSSSKFLLVGGANFFFSTNWDPFIPSPPSCPFDYGLPMPMPTAICHMNSKIMELRDWIDLAFSLQVSSTWATWLVISSSFDSMFVTREDKVLPPYKTKKTAKHIKSYMLHSLKTSNKNTAPLIQLKKKGVLRI